MKKPGILPEKNFFPFLYNPMKRKVLFFVLTLIASNFSWAQVFEVDTLQYKGDPDQFINLVMMGDGYTAAQQDQFVSAAQGLSDYLFTQKPFDAYRNYFNVFAIRVISTESGVVHPGTASDCAVAQVPVSNPQTFFDTRFDAYGIHRLVVPFNENAIAGVLADNFPAYDQVFIISNSPYYGGSGGPFATSTTNINSNEITAHEIGHSFAYLADEYYAGDIYAIEKPNKTQQNNPALVKWKNWLGGNNVGIYQHCCGGQSASWYKPHNNCKMKVLFAPLCAVCSEAIVEKIHGLSDPLVSFSPVESAVNSTQQFLDFRLNLIRPEPNTLKTEWKLNGNILAVNADSIRIDQSVLPDGNYFITAIITDTTAKVRTDGHASLHFSTVNWSFSRLFTETRIIATSNSISLSVSPNPTDEFLNISLEFTNPENFSLEVLSVDGKLVRRLADDIRVSGNFERRFSLEKLPAGEYLLLFRIGNSTQTRRIVKQN
jgi:hypothetical protein